MQLQSPDPNRAPAAIGDDEKLELGYIQESTPNGRLLSTAINTIALSRRVTLVFCPTVAHLRARLSVFQIAEQAGELGEGRTRQGRPMMAVVDLLAGHARDSELSAQSLSRSLALAVEVSARENVDLLLCDCREIRSEGPNGGRGLWDVDIPLLNDSAVGVHGMVQAKKVAGRWFEFEKERHAYHRAI
jgi:hypothetical protein